MTKKILITGAHGFVGTHVVRTFVDTFINKYDGEYDILIPDRHQLDLLYETTVQNYLADHQPYFVIHLAALCGGILANKNSPADFINTNLRMAVNLFHNVQKYGKTEFLYTLGTVCAYPKFCPVPFKEEDIWNGYPEETNAPYGIAKRAVMMMQQAYYDQYGLKGAHLIPTNMYGDHDKFDPTTSHVIPAFIRKILMAKKTDLPQTIFWGSGNATRDFLYAGDLAEALVACIKKEVNHPAPMNIGTGIECKISDLAKDRKSVV
jgi:GDP-L-fucose synthase